MNVVSSKEVLGSPDYDYEGSNADILSFLLNADGSWGEIDDIEPELDTIPVVPMKLKKHLGSIASASGLRLPFHLDAVKANGLGVRAFGLGVRAFRPYSYKRGVPNFYGKKQKDDSDAKLSQESENTHNNGENNSESEFYDDMDNGQFRGKRFMGESLERKVHYHCERWIHSIGLKNISKNSVFYLEFYGASSIPKFGSV